MKVHFLVLLFGFLKSSDALVNIENPLFDQTMNRKVNELISEALKEHKSKIDQLEELIFKQEKRIGVLEGECKVKENKSLFTWRDTKIENIMRMADKAYNQKLNDKTAVKNDGVGQIERIRRDFASAGQPVGFYAYMSGSENRPSTSHPLIFDVVKTNLGSAYSIFSGGFTAPVEGAYVFSWTITADFFSYIHTEIVINASSFGHLMTDGDEIHDIHVSSKTVVAYLNQGDFVVIRTHSSISSKGNIISGNYGQTSFSGWKI